MSAIADRLPELLQREAYPHPAPDVRLIETHISWVLLAGQHAYKLRKPVDYGFLDFTTREKRQADCEAELLLNRRLCPDMYLDVVQVVERDGHLSMGGSGKELEPAVHMRRLPDAGMLPALLQRNIADQRLMQRVATVLVEFHHQAATGPGIDDHACPAALMGNWSENFSQTMDFLGRTLSTTARDDVRRYIADFISSNRELLERRMREGRIRDGHGDLHAGSVCVSGRKIYLFDCVEFNARFRCADVAAEVAFLAMDLDHLGRADLGHAFIDAYVRRSRDAELVNVLDFYKCYRAFVRGKVLSFRLAEPHVPALDAQRVADDARAYFELAHEYAVPSTAPRLLVTMGLPASGKSTLAQAVAGRLGAVQLSSDVQRKLLAGLRPTEHQYVPFGRGLYSPSMSRRTYAALKRQAARWLRRGRSVVVDATCGQPADRAVFRQLARRTGARFLIVWCQADENVLRARLAARPKNPDTTSDARLDLWPALRSAFTPPAETPDVLVVDTTLPLSMTVDAVLRGLRAVRPRRKAA